MDTEMPSEREPDDRLSRSNPAAAVRRVDRRGSLVLVVVDGSDDLGAVDPVQVSRCDRRVGMPELALNHDQRDPFARHFYCVSMPELVRRESASHTSRRRDLMQLGRIPAGAQGRPSVGPPTTQNSRPTGNAFRSAKAAFLPRDTIFIWLAYRS